MTSTEALLEESEVYTMLVALQARREGGAGGIREGQIGLMRQVKGILEAHKRAGGGGVCM